MRAGAKEEVEQRKRISVKERSRYPVPILDLPDIDYSESYPESEFNYLYPVLNPYGLWNDFPNPVLHDPEIGWKISVPFSP